MRCPWLCVTTAFGSDRPGSSPGFSSFIPRFLFGRYSSSADLHKSALSSRPCQTRSLMVAWIFPWQFLHQVGSFCNLYLLCKLTNRAFLQVGHSFISFLRDSKELSHVIQIRGLRVHRLAWDHFVEHDILQNLTSVDHLTLNGFWHCKHICSPTSAAFFWKP